MTLVGIIANPSASKDIRRLVAQGRVVPDWEKVNTLRRVLLGLQAVGIGRVVAMPDSSHLVQRARDDAQLSLDLDLLEMPAFYTEDDTVRAAALMEQMGVGCLVTLGGDGTNRAAAKGSVSMPMVAISTGTNNVFPTNVEGTLAGLAAGLLVQGHLDLEQVSVVSKLLEVHVDGEYRDMALVDVALSRERFVATRAIWDMSTIFEVFLTRAEPSSIGLSSVGARLQPLSLTDEGGLYYRIGESAGQDGQGGREAAANSASVLAPIAPGVVCRVPIACWRPLPIGELSPVEQRYCTIALDGERAFSVTPAQRVEVGVNRNGPPVVQVDAALSQAAELGIFRE
ncbi:MAG: NAD(+)/NADH kinase [Chloroflexi bacterium]|nr:NAD(+)/NADH kinase [Chloroflexota bacterium]MCI0798820.1 NAD(+)/NADH kinase [Chloroflexota bacterium]MCI0823289.1 NAD(+)/NADH kinase [Chloroflexota bacterium]MCI0866068.1 NAD(+)/NADH kinase [Chloroflexota bacterium]MCI0877558.1 NAD(+)/NADH kinase [Chloroflexota bacterium]